jgi:hypothetical protein
LVIIVRIVSRICSAVAVTGKPTHRLE